MKRLTLMLLALVAFAGGALAQPYTFDVVNVDEADFTYWPVLFGGNLVAQGNLVQCIKPGTDNVMQPPNPDGTLGGDDLLGQTFVIGDGFGEDGMFSATLTGWPVGQNPFPSSLIAGNTFYLRFWYNVPPIGATPVPNTAYYFTQGPFTVPSVGASIIWNIHPLNVWTPIFSGAPEIDVTPMSHDFGTVTVGNTVNTTITINNTGTLPLIISGVQATGGFAVSGLPAFPHSINPAGTLPFTASFTPGAAQPYSGNVVINSNDADEGTVNVGLMGVGQNPATWNPGGNPASNPGLPTDPWTPSFDPDPATNGFVPFGVFFAGGGTNPSSLNVFYTLPSNGSPEIQWALNQLLGNMVQRMFNVTQTGGGTFNATLTFRFLGSDWPGTLPIPPATNFYARGYNPGTMTWSYLYGPYNNNVTWSMVDDNGTPGVFTDDVYEVVVNNVDSFSEWYLSEDSELPVNMSAFYASAGDRRVNLSWATESEINNSYFKIERRIANGTWNEIARVNTRNGNSSTRLTYIYADMGVANGNTYEYRISDVSIDGVVTRYAQTVNATPRAEVIADYSISNYPNPFNPETKISFTIREAGAVKLTITNVMGQSVATLINGVNMDKGTHNIVWNAGNLPSGIYLLRYEVNGFSTISKLVLSR